MNDEIFKIKSKKSAIEMLVQELYESKNTIWADMIHACLIYLAEDAGCANASKQLKEHYSVDDIAVIHKADASVIVKEEMKKALEQIESRSDKYINLIFEQTEDRLNNKE